MWNTYFLLLFMVSKTISANLFEISTFIVYEISIPPIKCERYSVYRVNWTRKKLRQMGRVNTRFLENYPINWFNHWHLQFLVRVHHTKVSENLMYTFVMFWQPKRTKSSSEKGSFKRHHQISSSKFFAEYQHYIIVWYKHYTIKFS